MNSKALENGVTPERLANALGLDIGSAEDESIIEQPQVLLQDSHSGKADGRTYEEYVQASKLLARELGFAPGQSGLMINGRIIGPIERGAFIAADFKALEEYEHKKRTEAAIEALEHVCSWVTDLGRCVPVLELTMETANNHGSCSSRTDSADLVSFTASILGAIQLPDPSDIGIHDATPKPRARPYLGLQRNLTYVLFDPTFETTYLLPSS
jgi:UDP-glucose:glycoprotein glucosyltransferase